MNEDDFERAQSGGGNLLAHLPSILKDRYLLVVIPAVLACCAGVAAAFLLPTVYRSTATLLVESPQLPEDVLGAGSVDLVDQRIARY
jgi:succinoglycan biosynthesis transport protein ExoP